MTKNNSKISISDAMKIYNGTDPVKQTLIMWSILTSVFLMVYTFIRITAAASGEMIGPDDGEVISGISRTTFTMFMGFTSILGSFMVLFQEFYKESAGGKYFRSVCGGFDTYSRMKSGQMFHCIFGNALFSVLVFLINAVFHLVSSCFGVCVTVFLVSLSGVAVGRLICMIKNQIAKSMLFCGFMGVYALICTCIVGITDGKLTSVHIVLLILAVIMIPFAHFTDLKNYRKKHWYN
ncbi:hypothetical protein [Ruminococcus sp. HUN007]|uniref:hypothetical protein n=1 Tax=Ruminococcus sp. HUN007 TaxID=1514668 RepID=UPI0005D184AE|nr:hypothetical protein [Ruminococcus sp. HUN007]